MNTIASSFILWISGITLIFFGAAQMQIKGESETDGSSSLIAENIRSRGSQNFGLVIGMIGFGCMAMKQKKNEPSDK